jgi:RNA polymerase sigma-70 factor (ECF subfamily)
VRPRFSFDDHYVRRLIAEDPETERHFTEYFSELLSSKLRARLRSPELVEDARQETFLRVFTTLKKKGDLEDPGSLGAFVNAVCNNVLLEIFRSSTRTTALDHESDQIPAADPTIEWQVLKSEERLAVRKAVAGLPARDQNLIRWLFFDSRNKDDVCRELHVDREYLRVLLHRAKQRLRKRFAGREQPRQRGERSCAPKRPARVGRAKEGSHSATPSTRWLTDRGGSGSSPHCPRSA